MHSFSAAVSELVLHDSKHSFKLLLSHLLGIIDCLHTIWPFAVFILAHLSFIASRRQEIWADLVFPVAGVSAFHSSPVLAAMDSLAVLDQALAIVSFVAL